MNKFSFLFLLMISLGSTPKSDIRDSEQMLIRIAEIEVFPQHLEEYRAILKEEAAVSVKIEPGVIAIFPMYEKENPTVVRIVEIYQNQDAYRTHLTTPHFLHYKETTLPMVKSLRLVEMDIADPQTMTAIFRKIKP